MRRLLPILSFALCAACWIGQDASAQPRNAASSASGGGAPTAASSSAGGAAARRENCGTPDEFRPCPPMPRVPLREYPANR